MLKERETLLVRTFFLKFWYTSKVSDALVRRGTLYIRTKFKVLGINFIVGRFRCMIYDCDEKYGACGHSGISWLFLG